LPESKAGGSHPVRRRFGSLRVGFPAAAGRNAHRWIGSTPASIPSA